MYIYIYIYIYIWAPRVELVRIEFKKTDRHVAPPSGCVHSNVRSIAN